MSAENISLQSDDRKLDAAARLSCESVARTGGHRQLRTLKASHDLRDYKSHLR